MTGPVGASRRRRCCAPERAAPATERPASRWRLRRAVLVWGTVAIVVSAVGALSAQTIRGAVTDRTSGRAIAGGQVLLLTEQRRGAAQATTNDSGRFVLVAPGPGRYRLQFAAPGYRLLITPGFEVRAGEALDYLLAVAPLPPVALDTAVIEGRPVLRYLAGFYQRRARGLGTFVTREEFERYHPLVTTDIVRRAQVFDVVANPVRSAGGDYRQVRIQSRRGVPYGFGPVAGECPPLLFLDGTLAGNARDVDVDDLVAVGAIEAVEFYEGGVQVPAEFAANGANCGVIAIWSRLEGGEPAIGEHRIELGAQLGGQWQDGGLVYGRAGLHAAIGLLGPVEFYPAVNFLVEGWSGAARPRAGWQLLIALRGRPLGTRSPAYLGGGLTMLDATEDRQIGTGLVSREISEEHFALLAGVAVPLPLLRPAIELHLVNPWHPDRAELQVFTTLAVRVR